MTHSIRLALLLLLAAISLAACLPSPDDPIEFLAEPDSIVIQMRDVSAEQLAGAEQIPLFDFTLYGDGTLIYLAKAGDQRYSTAHLPDDAIRDLLKSAVDEGFLEFAYEQPRSDLFGAFTTFLYVHTKEAANAISGYALDSVLPEDAGSEWEQFRRLREIVERLEEIDPVALGGSEPVEYVPESVLLTVEPTDAPNVAGSPLAWPFSAINLGEIARPGSGPIERRLEGADAALISGWLPATRFQHGERWFNVRYRPLLPFEEHFPEFEQP